MNTLQMALKVKKLTMFMFTHMPFFNMSCFVSKLPIH